MPSVILHGFFFTPPFLQPFSHGFLKWWNKNRAESKEAVPSCAQKMARCSPFLLLLLVRSRSRNPHNGNLCLDAAVEVRMGTPPPPPSLPLLFFSSPHFLLLASSSPRCSSSSSCFLFPFSPTPTHGSPRPRS